MVFNDWIMQGYGSLVSEALEQLREIEVNRPTHVFVQAAVAGDGEPRKCTGDLTNIMAGLACGEPMTIGWDILRNHASAFIAARIPILFNKSIREGRTAGKN